MGEPECLWEARKPSAEQLKGSFGAVHKAGGELRKNLNLIETLLYPLLSYGWTCIPSGAVQSDLSRLERLDLRRLAAQLLARFTYTTKL